MVQICDAPSLLYINAALISFFCSPLNRYSFFVVDLAVFKQMMNRVWNVIQWFVQSFVEAVSFSAYCGSVEWLLFSGGKEKLSMHVKQASPVCHCRTCDKYLLTIIKWKQRHQFEQPLWPPGFVLQYFQISPGYNRLDYLSVMCWKIEMVITHEYLSVFLRVDYGSLCIQCTLTVPALLDTQRPKKPGIVSLSLCP